MKWEPGARAAIVISEHFQNMNRVVTLVYKIEFMDNAFGWCVEDGKEFKGYEFDNQGRVTGYMMSMYLGIHQWKLRLLEDGDDIVIRDGIEYVENL